MKQPQFDHLNNTEKLDLILRKIDRIERKIVPPIWKAPLSWFMTHWFLVLTMGGLIWGMWHLWDEIQTIMRFVEGINTSVDSMKTGFNDFGSGAGKVTDSITDTIKKSIQDFNLFGQ